MVLNPGSSSEIIHQAIWLYLRFTLCLRDVVDLLAERGVAVSYETVRRWVNHFGPMIAADLRRSGSLGSNATMSAGDGRTTELRIRISRRDGASASCSGSRASALRRNSSRCMPPSSTLSMSSAI